MTLSQLYLTSLFLLGSGLLIGGWLTTRATAQRSNYWPLAWAALLAAGGVRVSPLPNVLDVGFATLFAAFMLAGSLQYAGRSVPRYFLLLSALYGVLAAFASSTELQGATRTVEFAFNVFAVAGSAVLVHRVAVREDRAWFHKSIGPGLCLLLVVVLFDFFSFSADEPSIEPWLFTSIPVATLQIVSLVDLVQARARDSAVALEQLVEERTEELVASRDRLREADRLAAVGTLAAGVAHQINNPVGAILNSAEYALLCAEESDAREIFVRALEVNVSQAKRCAYIVRSMLQFAREQPVETRVEDLSAVVQRASRATEFYARENGAEITLRLADTSLPVRMCAIEIEQVVVNIVRNAIESRETGARIEVRSERKGEVACILVSDNGRGISALYRDRIFEPFFSDRLQQGGTGLGLSVAHGIVTEHNGAIRIESDEGKGTRFAIELPLFDGNEDEPSA